MTLFTVSCVNLTQLKTENVDYVNLLKSGLTTEQVL